MKRILLIGPYGRNIRAGQFLSPPLGVYRLASYIQNKCGVDVVDPHLDREEVNRLLKENKYEIIGHSIIQPTIENSLRTIFTAYDLQPLALQIAGGQGAVFNYEELLKKSPIQVIVRGFGEFQLERILDSEKEGLTQIPGLYLKHDEKISATELSNPVSIDSFKKITLGINFSTIPYEKYWRLMSNHYSAENLKVMKNEGLINTIRLVTSTYCPVGCSYCSSTKFLNEGSRLKQKVLRLEAPDVIEMMKNAVTAHPDTESFYFNDDNFTGDLDELDKFCDSLHTLVKPYNLVCQGRINDAQDDILKKMKMVGFKLIYYGVETFSTRLARVLKRTHNGHYEDMARQAILSTLKAGIVPQMSLMLFIPQTKISDLETTINNAIDLIEKGARIAVLPYVEAYRGTDIIRDHALSYDEFEIKGVKFRFPDIIPPDEEDIRVLARDAMKLKESLNQDFTNKYFKPVPQPVDCLNLFMSIYKLIGKPTDKIKSLIDRLMS